jgi:hypothetical protein
MAAIKSKAQRRKFAQLLLDKKITPEAFERWNEGAGSKALPEHAGDRKKAKKKAARRPVKKRRAAKKSSSRPG